VGEGSDIAHSGQEEGETEGKTKTASDHGERGKKIYVGTEKKGNIKGGNGRKFLTFSMIQREKQAVVGRELPKKKMDTSKNKKAKTRRTLTLDKKKGKKEVNLQQREFQEIKWWGEGKKEKLKSVTLQTTRKRCKQKKETTTMEDGLEGININRQGRSEETVKLGGGKKSFKMSEVQRGTQDTLPTMQPGETKIVQKNKTRKAVEER